MSDLCAELKAKALEQAKIWALERGVCGEERFKAMYENALIKVTAEACCTIADSARAGCRAVPQNTQLLYSAFRRIQGLSLDANLLRKLHMKSLLCVFGIHKWRITQHATYLNETAKRLGITMHPAKRVCDRCGKTQYEDVHCLGLNPPEYVRTWYNC